MIRSWSREERMVERGGKDMEVEEKRRDGEEKKGEWEKCGRERGEAGGRKLEREREEVLEEGG